MANRKSAAAFQNSPLYLTCDTTWRRNRHDLISGPQTNREWEVGYWISESALIFNLGRRLVEKWANNSETVRDRPKVIINRKYEVWVCLSETVSIFDIQRHLAERMALRHLR